MRNAIFSQVSSQLYNFGSNEVQFPSLEVSMPVDSTIYTNDASFSLETNVINHSNQQKSDGFTVPYQAPDYLLMTSFRTFTCDNISEQQSKLLSSNIPVTEGAVDFQACKMKRLLLPERSTNDLIESNRSLTGWKHNKRKKANPLEQEWNCQIKESTNSHKVPAKRSQKLGDKITVLQKLVSPYGKADTAAVLQEASLYIKLLQEQIQNLFRVISSSESNLTTFHHSQEIGNGVTNLRSRGLCLVPLTVVQRIAHKDSILA